MIASNSLLAEVFMCRELAGFLPVKMECFSEELAG